METIMVAEAEKIPHPDLEAKTQEIRVREA